MKLSIIMPAYNERRTIGTIVPRVLGVDIGGMERELIIVDDGSVDGTRDILAGFTDPASVLPRLQEAVRRIAQETGADVVIPGEVPMTHAAALPHLAYPSYLMSPLKYREQITAEQIAVVDAHVAVSTGPGLGIEVDEDALRHLDARRR